MEKKYKFSGNTKIFNGKELHQIEAVKDFKCKGYSIKKGETGGYIEKEENLSQEGTCWIRGNAMVFENAKVTGDALLSCNAMVFGESRISGEAELKDNIMVYGHAKISGYPHVGDSASVFDRAEILNGASVFGHAKICEHATIGGLASIYGNATISGSTTVSGRCEVSGNAIVSLNYDNSDIDELLIDDFDICNNSLITDVHKDVLYISKFSFCNYPITFTRQSDSRIFVNLRGFFNDDIDKFVNYIESNSSGDESERLRLKYETELIVKFAKSVMTKVKEDKNNGR